MLRTYDTARFDFRNYTSLNISPHICQTCTLRTYRPFCARMQRIQLRVSVSKTILHLPAYYYSYLCHSCTSETRYFSQYSMLVPRTRCLHVPLFKLSFFPKTIHALRLLYVRFTRAQLSQNRNANSSVCFANFSPKSKLAFEN
jgi:hypothetical protein